MSVVALDGSMVLAKRASDYTRSRGRWLPVGVGAASPATAEAAVGAFRRVLRSESPHIVFAGPIQTGTYVAALAGAPSLVAVSWGYDMMHDVDRGRSWAAATRVALDGSARVVCDCRAVLHRLADLGVEPERIVELPWGTDVRRFQPRVTKGIEGDAEDQSEVVVLCVRAWEPMYRIDVALEAFRQAWMVEPRLRLLLAGGGSLEPDVKAAVDRLGISSAVNLVGAISHLELPDVYALADIYLSTSPVDGTSVSLLEAFASGLPVVVSDIPGNREWVTTDGGVLVRPNDPAAFADAILQLVAMGDGRRVLGTHNRGVAETRADWGQNVERLRCAFLELERCRADAR